MALLAQTCSQIGADSGSLKPLPMDKNKNKSMETSKSPSKTPKSNTSPQEHRPLAFKPYETNVLSRDCDRPSSKSSSTNGSVYDEKIKNSHSSNSARVPSRSKLNSSPIELSAVNNNNNNNNKSESSSVGKQTPNGSDRKSTSPDGSQRGASPIVRSGLEVLHGHSSKDLGAFKPNPFALNPLAALCCPPGMEQHANPAFRPSFGPNSFSHHHAAMLAAAAGYPNTASQYLSYTRIKTPSGGETVVPICKDPYCTGCQYSQHNQQMMLGIPCPAGCVQCEQQKFSLAVAMSNAPHTNPHYAQLDRPFMCSWMVSDGYCGKRYSTSDELAQHLRSHTSNPADPTAAAILVQAQQRAMAMMHPFNSLLTASSMHRGYPAPLSPMSAARYHPYAKAAASAASQAGMPPSLQGSPYSFNPASLNPAALNPYYQSYAMYSQRLGAAAAAAAAHQ